MVSSLTNDFKRLIVENVPLIDVRAAVEFDKGAFPFAVNLPLLNDKEREEVGICYKEKGNEKAVELGHKLICGDIKEARISAWETFIQKHPDAVLYCFRGGQRSRISQEWLHQRGYPVSRIEGGYKAFRNYLLNELDSMDGRFTPLILSGHTGSGKTLLLQRFQDMIDLEALANHRGSAFGGFMTSQPTQIEFENRLAYSVIQKLDKGAKHLLFEDEGMHVGRLYIPKKFYETIAKSDMIMLETPFIERVDITFDEYVLQSQKNYSQKFPRDTALDKWEEMMQENINRIHRRLGDKRHRELLNIFKKALSLQKEQNELNLHKEWIGILLKDYYDPMYEYQFSKKENHLIFRGDKDEVEDFLRLKKLVKV